MVHPDHITAWHLSIENSEEQTNNHEYYWARECKEVVEKVTGFSQKDGSDLKVEFDGSKNQQKMMSYQAWLTKQFFSRLRPYGFIFTESVPVHNETKHQALEKVKRKKAMKDKEFDFTTRTTTDKNKAQLPTNSTTMGLNNDKPNFDSESSELAV